MFERIFCSYSFIRIVADKPVEEIFAIITHVRQQVILLDSAFPGFGAVLIVGKPEWVCLLGCSHQAILTASPSSLASPRWSFRGIKPFCSTTRRGHTLRTRHQRTAPTPRSCQELLRSPGVFSWGCRWDMSSSRSAASGPARNPLSCTSRRICCLSLLDPIPERYPQSGYCLASQASQEPELPEVQEPQNLGKCRQVRWGGVLAPQPLKYRAAGWTEGCFLVWCRGGWC